MLKEEISGSERDPVRTVPDILAFYAQPFSQLPTQSPMPPHNNRSVK